MRTAFADTVYWQALVDSKDGLHTEAILLTRSLRVNHVSIITSDMVLTEFLNALGKDSRRRTIAIAFIDQLKADANLEIIPFSDCPFDVAYAVYRQYVDKGRGLTDCCSFRIMWDRGIQDALTHDHHFTQAGFNILL